MARELDNGAWNIEPVQGYPEGYGTVFMALDEWDSEMLLFIPYHVGSDFATIGWLDGGIREWQFMAVPGFNGSPDGALLIHPKEYPVAVSGRHLAAYW